MNHIYFQSPGAHKHQPLSTSSVANNSPRFVSTTNMTVWLPPESAMLPGGDPIHGVLVPDHRGISFLKPPYTLLSSSAMIASTSTMLPTVMPM